MTSQPQSESNPVAVLERLRRAISQHDLDALAACFEPDFSDEFPAHSGLDVRGHEQQRRNWAGTFTAVPDIQATLVRSASEGRRRGPSGSGRTCAQATPRSSCEA